jgi:hypothetical protein
VLVPGAAEPASTKLATSLLVIVFVIAIVIDALEADERWKMADYSLRNFDYELEHDARERYPLGPGRNTTPPSPD